MKLIINIPCYNEEETIERVIKDLPKKITGISQIKVQVIDDGSQDRTGEIAKKCGAQVIQHAVNRGLGEAFKTGMKAALEKGADIMVNTDADHQYPGKYIPALVYEILHNKADLVIGNRQPWKVKYFSIVKRIFQWFGNMVVRRLIGTKVQDTVSGFRAYSKNALLHINVTTKFSYVLDTIVQSVKKGLKIVEIPIDTNPPTRDSRLFKNIFHHMYKSGLSMLRVSVIYEPFKTFMFFGVLFSIPAILLILRFLYFYFTGDGSGHIQSLVIAVFIFSGSGFFIVIAIVAGLIGVNRKIIEDHYNQYKKQIYD
ncbi:MAG: glycosyltransferase family 2 protein [Leptospirales bacterium]